jgi:phenylpropionate dioxygenase-like ring-hydroxylating dioxygenase large terminal subunit
MTPTFNNPHQFVQGWYWALPSRGLAVGQVQAITLLGRNLAIYRSASRRVIAMDAYCPHMGTHLAEGRVEGEGIRCFFHNWKYSADGQCLEVPSLGKALPVCVKTWQTAEHYGLIWVWAGEGSPRSLPHPPELADQQVDYVLGSSFQKNCHPNVLLVNAIDTHHFNTVHDLPVEIVFAQDTWQGDGITFCNTTRGVGQSRFMQLLLPLYREAITYTMCYWYGNTGTVTVGPDLQHFYIVFALRPTAGGKAEGQTILVTSKRSGCLGWGINRVLLGLSQWVGHYFAKGDTKVFQTIRFDLKTPIAADQSVLQLMSHINQQPALTWETWQPLALPSPAHITPEMSMIIPVMEGQT